MQTIKIENKYGMSGAQNAHIIMKDVFVPLNNKLTHSKNFAIDINKLLEATRLTVGWFAAGMAVGAYEAALKYCL